MADMHDDDDLEEPPIVDKTVLRRAVVDALNYYRKQVASGGDMAWNAANQIINAAGSLAHLDCKPIPNDDSQWQ